MRKQMCRICGRSSELKNLEVHVSRQGFTRLWCITACRDCWRVFETMLDSAAGGYQAALVAAGQPGVVWFW